MGRRTTTNNTNDITSNDTKLLLDFFKKEVYTKKDLMNLFDVSDKTITGYMNDGYLGFTQVGRVILYSPLDIINFMMMNHHNPYRSEVVS